MNPNNNEDDLEQVNRLLERLHQAGYDHHCSQFTLVYVASGAQHVDRIDTQNIKTLPDPPRKKENPLAWELPKELHTDEAMALWQKAQQAGYVDERNFGTATTCEVITTWLSPNSNRTTFRTN